tara:strand:+ start:358 stop:651 length:294 start_codon:yes stop_codon:yes gene_type:complete
MTNTDYNEAMEITGKNKTELFKWSQDMQPAFIVNRSDDAVQIVYTDGDDGLIILSGFCDSFEDCGIKIETISAYCDIADVDLIAILKIIREPYGIGA